MKIETEPKTTSQARRNELGRLMGLDVGDPDETTVMLDGKVVPARDRYGILMDTQRYATRTCNSCHGRGVVTQVTPVPSNTAKRILERDLDPTKTVKLDEKAIPAHLLHLQTSGKYVTKISRMCSCASRRYQVLQERFVDRLIEEGLAKSIGERLDERGKLQRNVVLL